VPDASKRDVLPIPDRPYAGLVAYDAKDPATSFPPIEPLRPPSGAPNVLVVLLDDVGFGASSAFGGPCQTPTAERLAAGGLKYTRFHTTALCSPTRQALLTGRNHHSVGMGGITEIATSAPGYNSIRLNTAAPLAETLKLNGYSTAQFGKCHEVPVWQTSPMGPFDAWPSGGGGFEHFYGFIGGEAHQYYPALYDGTVPVEPDKTPDEGYHLMEDMTDRAIRWIHQQKALMGDKPFFKGWTAVTKHKTPWILVGGDMLAFDDDRWELYDTTTDWSQAHDLAKEQPDRLHELQRLWLIEATKYNVLPLDDRAAERVNPDLAGRPTLLKGNSQILFSGMGRLSENSVINIKNKSHAVTAEVVVPSSGAEGVIIAQGGSIGGWSLYAKDGKLRYCYNLLGVQRFYVGGDRPIPAGKHQLRMEFAYDGGGLGKGGGVVLFLDGEKVGEGRVAATAAMIFSADDTCDVGMEGGAVVSEDYGPRGNQFSGEVHWVQIDLGDAAEDLDHLITPEERLRVAMAKQ
jgi:hypothetical protein